MSRAFAPLLFALVLATGCLPCRTRQDCGPGEFCEFNSGDCVQGCTGPDDCAPTARCDPQLGQCRPGGGTLVELDASTATTSPDAGQ